MTSDEQDEALDIMPEARQSGRNNSPANPGLRQRPLGRASTFTDPTPQSARRSSSFVSETLSESHRSFKSSTDDLFLPRVSADHDSLNSDSSNWQSLPLALALLPAIGGLFFQNGSAFITDISLLGIAALFLNWAVRLPWDWYLSAQAVVRENESQVLDSAIEDESSPDGTPTTSPQRQARGPDLSDRALAAQSELRVHEFLALLACFAFPVLGAWLLHAIRSQLSRPSEGLVSDYNLTIFLLASEVRPLTHLIKLVQRRTLFLQRTISTSATKRHLDRTDPKVTNIAQRLEELEAHVANAILLPAQSGPGTPSPADELIVKASTQANADIRKTFQPELDALNRAMRRYEKRTTMSAIQIETRLQELEGTVQDVMILAAATQRNADKQSGKYTPILLNWISAAIVVPVQYMLYFMTFPQRMLNKAITIVRRRLGFAPPPARGKDGKGSSKSGLSRQRSKEKSKAQS